MLDPVELMRAEIVAALRDRAERAMRLAIDEDTAPTPADYLARSPFAPATEDADAVGQRPAP